MKHCLDCGFVGQPQQYTPGSDHLEVRLWYLLIVPGVLYLLWRKSARYTGCARCKSEHIVSMDTPIAQAALRRLSPTPSAQSWVCMSCGEPIFGGGHYCANCITSASKAG
jgi:hypothetical protein